MRGRDAGGVLGDPGSASLVEVSLSGGVLASPAPCEPALPWGLDSSLPAMAIGGSAMKCSSGCRALSLCVFLS